MKTALKMSIIDDAVHLAERIPGSLSGDVLNHVNACTALATYLEPGHPLFLEMADPLSALPRSQGATDGWDFLLRLLAAARIGIPELDGSQRSMRRVWRRIFGDEEIPNPLPIGELYSRLRANPELGSRLEVSPTFIAEYLALLSSNCHIRVDSEYIQFILDVTLRQKVPIELINAIPELLYRSNVCNLLGKKKLAEEYCNYTEKALEKMLDEISRDKSKAELYMDERLCLDRLCFIGINSGAIERFSPSVASLCRQIVTATLLTTFERWSHKENDLRLVALRLAGIHAILDNEMRYNVANEFNATLEFGEFEKIRDKLRQISTYEHRLMEIVEGRNGIKRGQPPSADQLLRVARSIDSQEITYSVQHPLSTLGSRKGDCKAVSMLLAAIIIATGGRGKLCLFFGKELPSTQNGKCNNHMFVKYEIPEEAENWKVVDQTDDYSDYYNHKLVIEYPISSLVTTKVKEIRADLAAKRLDQKCRLGV